MEKEKKKSPGWIRKILSVFNQEKAVHREAEEKRAAPHARSSKMMSEFLSSNSRESRRQKSVHHRIHRAHAQLRPHKPAEPARPAAPVRSDVPSKKPAFGGIFKPREKPATEPMRPMPASLPKEIIKEFVASDIMTGKVISIRDKDTLEYVLRLLDEKNISGAPVLNRVGNLVGTVSETDIIRFVGAKDLIDAQENRLDMLKDAKVEDIMRRNVVNVRESTPIHEVNHLMNKHDIARVFVLDDKRQVVGIVTRADMVKGISKEMLMRMVHKPREVEKGDIGTDVDRVLEIVDDKGSISVDEIKKKVDISMDKIEEWGRVLERHNLIEIVYPPVGRPIFVKRKVTHD